MLLHLTQREKKQIVHFPSLMFVRRIPYQSVRRRKIQNWLLLLVRLAALALIVAGVRAAVAPRRRRAGRAGQGAREVVVLLDTSYSMGYGDRWERARAAAHDAIDGLSRLATAARSCCFSSGAEIAAARRRRAIAALDGGRRAAKPGAGATRYAPALKVAGSILAESPLPRREVILISDFQRAGWRGEEGIAAAAGAPR